MARKCSICRSKKWYKDPASGVITCSEGHVLQNYRTESNEKTDLGSHLLRKRKLKSGRKKAEKLSRADSKLFHGERAKYHYFQALQLVFRMQVEALIEVWRLPPEFETICRDLWYLHIDHLPNPPAVEHILELNDDSLATRPDSEAEANTAGEGLDSDKKGDAEADEERGEDEVTENEEDDEDDGNSSASSTRGRKKEMEDELSKLLREASELGGSESDSDGEGEGGRHWETSANKASKKRKGRDVYASPTGNLAVLIVACWMMRVPLIYIDFIRLIESYELPYLETVRLLPKDFASHLTKQKVQALSPYRPPTVLTLHKRASRLAALLQSQEKIIVPELNAAPILWRAVLALYGTPVLYSMAKALSAVLEFPLTLHPSLSKPLRQQRQYDPRMYRHDNIPPELSLVSSVVIMLRLVYGGGLEGKRLTTPPSGPDDPAASLPTFEEWFAGLKSEHLRRLGSREELFSASSAVNALDLSEEALDDYIAFCERALVAGGRGSDEAGLEIMDDFFPLPGNQRQNEDPAGGTMTPYERAPMRRPELSEVSEDIIGQPYTIYSGRDSLGSVPAELDFVFEVAGRWCGVGKDDVAMIVDQFERRADKWCRRNREAGS